MSNEVDDCFHSLEQVMEEDLENFLMYEEAHHSSSSSSSIHDAVAENENQETQEESTHHRKKRNLTMDERRHIIDDLLIMLVNGKLPKGAITNTARKFGVNRSTIHNLWKSAKAQRAQNKGIDVKQRRKGKCGKKKKEYSEEMLQSVPLHLRSTIRSFAGSLKLPHATVQRLLQRGQLRSHTSSTKPCLTDQQKLARMQWVLSHIIPKTLTNPPTFQDMYNIIHIDEKWFYLNPDQRRFIMLPREDDPHGTTQSKRYKIKVMFLAVVSRPIYDESGNMKTHHMTF